jgi:YD repeat-containing protein
MSVRAPLYNNSGNIQEMSTAMVDQIVDQVVYQYSLNPSVALSVVSSGGSLDAITDTRKQAGAASTSATAFPSEATTAEPSTVTVTYDKLTSTTSSVSPTSDTGTTWPLYYNSSGQIQAMNLQDVKDTFLHPAIDLLTAGTTTSQQAGTHWISSNTSETGSTRVSATPIFTDTRADTSAYTAGGIGETLDQPTTITNYYLYTVDGSDTSYTLPISIDASNNLQIYPDLLLQANHS